MFVFVIVAIVLIVVIFKGKGGGGGGYLGKRGGPMGLGRVEGEETVGGCNACKE